MDNIRRDKRKEVHARLDFEENSKKSRRVREGSRNSSAGTLPARAHSTDLAILTRQVQPSPGRTGQTLRIVLTVEVVLTDGTLLLAYRPRSRDRLRGIEESYGNTCSSYRTGARHRYHSRDKDRSRSMKRGRESESPLSRVSESGTSDGGHWKSK
ncbi:hypothetical protein Tco_0613113 [Tanacetum coccineum]